MHNEQQSSVHDRKAPSLAKNRPLHVNPTSSLLFTPRVLSPLSPRVAVRAVLRDGRSEGRRRRSTAGGFGVSCLVPQSSSPVHVLALFSVHCGVGVRREERFFIDGGCGLTALLKEGPASCSRRASGPGGLLQKDLEKLLCISRLQARALARIAVWERPHREETARGALLAQAV